MEQPFFPLVQLFICVCALAHYRSIHEGLRRQLMGVHSLLLPCGSRVLNSGSQAWWKVPLPTKPPACPFLYSIM